MIWNNYDYFWLARAYPNQPLFRLSEDGSRLVGLLKWYELEKLKIRVPNLFGTLE